MSDYIVKATAANGTIRAYAATTKELVEEARKTHNLSPVATAALGRTMTAAVIMGSMQKNDDDMVSIIIRGDGPMQGLVVTATSKLTVKGYVYNPSFVNEANYFGHFDVGGALGYGTLTVIKDIGLKEPYSGTVNLVTGEIGDDLTYYFATSEQTPSSVGLGVLMNKENTVREAGGFIIQLMPDAPEEVIGKLEAKIGEITSVTDMLDKGMTPEDILSMLLSDMDLKINEKVNPKFMCDCSKERVMRAVMSTGKKEIESMIADGKPVEVNCQFCRKNYEITLDELKAMISDK